MKIKKVKCNHCSFTWEKGTDSGHSKDDCIERLKDFKKSAMTILDNLLFWDTVPDKWKELIKELTTEQGERG